MSDQKLPARKRKPPKPDHFVQFDSEWMRGAAQGWGVVVLPVLLMIVGFIVIQLAQILAAR